MPEVSYQTFREAVIQMTVDDLIARDQRAYRDRQWLQQPAKKVKRKPARDNRGSKAGVKRGPYKKHETNQPKENL